MSILHLTDSILRYKLLDARVHDPEVADEVLNAFRAHGHQEVRGNIRLCREFTHRAHAARHGKHLHQWNVGEDARKSRLAKAWLDCGHEAVPHCCMLLPHLSHISARLTSS